MVKNTLHSLIYHCTPIEPQNPETNVFNIVFSLFVFVLPMSKSKDSKCLLAVQYTYILYTVMVQAWRVCDPIGGEYRSPDPWDDRPHHLAGQIQYVEFK